MAYNIFDFSHFWSNLKTLLSNKVDKVSGMGLSQNSFTNDEKTKLADTYTKSEVDTALAAKLNTSDVDATLSSTSTNPVQNKAVQAPIARLVDAGAKNLLKNDATSQSTVVVNPDGTMSINGTNSGSVNLEISVSTVLPAGDYVLSAGDIAISVYLTARIATGGDQYTCTGQTKFVSFHLDAETQIERIYLFINNGTTISNLTVKPMICTAEDYNISSEFVPYAKSNYELTQATEPIPRLVDSVVKNLLKITATSQTINGVTFTVNDDGTITANGTNTGTGSATFVIVSNQQAIQIPDGDYWLSGCPQGGSSDTFDLRWYRYSPNASVYDTGIGAAIHKSGNTAESNIAIVVKSGVTVNNITFKPMLCTAEDYAISQEFVPYSPTMRELYEMILALQNAQNV